MGRGACGKQRARWSVHHERTRTTIYSGETMCWNENVPLFLQQFLKHIAPNGGARAFYFRLHACVQVFIAIWCFVREPSETNYHEEARPERKRGDIYISTISGMGLFFFLRHTPAVPAGGYSGGRGADLACFFFFAESAAVSAPYIVGAILCKFYA